MVRVNGSNTRNYRVWLNIYPFSVICRSRLFSLQIRRVFETKGSVSASLAAILPLLEVVVMPQEAELPPPAWLFGYLAQLLGVRFYPSSALWLRQVTGPLWPPVCYLGCIWGSTHLLKLCHRCWRACDTPCLIWWTLAASIVCLLPLMVPER